MKASPLRRGDVLIVAFPEHLPAGREQEGQRPAVVVGLPSDLGTPRYPMVVVAPVTSSIGDWTRKSPALYPVLPPRAGNLSRNSAVLLDHLRGVDLSRIRKRIGALSEAEYAPLHQGLQALLGAQP